MAIRTYKVTLDSKNTIAPEPVYLRQGDKTGAVVIDATLMDNGSPVSLSGITPMFKANTADGHAVIADSNGFTVTDSANGKFAYQVPNALSAIPGKITTAYFSLSDADGSESTFDVAFIIKSAVDISQGQAEDYITIIDGTLNSLQKKIDDMNTDIKTVLNAYNHGDFYNKSETDSKDGATLSSAKTYTDNSLSGIVALPETFTNLDAIKAKYPTGANGVMVAADNGHKYIWAGAAWTDAGVYQSAGLADHSIEGKKIKQPLTRGVIIQGNITIDDTAGKVTFSKNLALDINGRYTYPNTAQTVTIPAGTGPAYLYLDTNDNTYHVDRNDPNANVTTTNSDVYIASVHQKQLHLYGSNTSQFVTYSDGLVEPHPDHADLLLGSLTFDPSAKTITSTGGLAFSNKRTTFSISAPFVLTLTKDFASAAVGIFYDKVAGALVEFTGWQAPASYIHVATLYGKEVYGADLRHWTYAGYDSMYEREPITQWLSFGTTPIITLAETSASGTFSGTMDMKAGACFVTQSNGKYVRIGSAQHLAYSYTQDGLDKGSLLSFFWSSVTGQVYDALHKTDKADIKLWSVYRGKVYGTDPRAYLYNGVPNGGWSAVSPADSIPTLDDWQNSALKGTAGNIGWLGDSTWEGYRVKDPENIFPTYLNTLLPGLFPGVQSFDCSKGGYTTQQLYENFDTLTANATNLKLLFIGGGLNDGDSPTNSKSWLDKIVQKCYLLGITPVIATTQATAVLYSDSAAGGDWGGMKQRNFERINRMKRHYAAQHNIPLLDFEKYTHEFIELSDSKMADMFVDYLHGMDPIHIYEANLAMAFLSPFCDQIRANKLIGITTMQAESGVSYNLMYKPLDTVTDGFKARMEYTAKDGDMLLSYDCFIPTDGHSYNLNGFNYGASVTVELDGTASSLLSSGKVTTLTPGYHIVQAMATAGNIDFAGFTITQSEAM